MNTHFLRPDQIPAPAPSDSHREVVDETTAHAVHLNASIIDYLASRVFVGFQLKTQSDSLVFTTSDDTIITLLFRAKLIKQEDEELVSLDVTVLLAKRSALRKAGRELRLGYEREFTDLMDALNAIHAFSDPAVKERLQEGYVAYNDLPVLFPRGTEVVAYTPSGMLGGVIETCSEVTSLFGNYFYITLMSMVPTSKGCCVGKVGHKVYNFDGTRMPIDKLGIRPITPEDKTKLTERGRIFRMFTQEPTPATYHGVVTIPTWFRDRVMGADGRVMVDSVNFAQIEADLYFEMMRHFGIDEDSTTGIVKDEDLWRCYSRVHGFSMRLKRWGWLDVEGLKPVKWQEDAFNQLVLSPVHKNAILHLVKHYGTAFTDFIQGKSGGLIFLLSGSTGTGKTLTSEAVAETLHRPLYSVSVGELGTTPEELEEKLRGILDLAYQWNAVLLLDEADIYMEARDTNNIQRNAMVSIFLRLLEYYSGVLFLTTNRVKTFDSAFFSRISLAISYPRLVAEDRYNVWFNVLTSAGIDATKFDLDELAGYEVNGRNIKTATRIAQTMAVGDHRPMTQQDLTNVLKLTEGFNHEVNI